jgi:exodeoxyribonuclease-3
MMKIISWNVNGLRSMMKKGFMEWVEKASPDILCLQETKAHPDQLDDVLVHPPGYIAYYNAAEKKGYSGVSTWCKVKPMEVRYGFGDERFDREGRVIQTDHGAFILFNVYFPNGQRDDERLRYKLDFYDAILEHFEKLRQSGRRLVICGDYNTAHKPIDLARPKENENNSGFLPVERAWLDKIVGMGYIDTFREFNQNPDEYTYWDNFRQSRERNVGWRIDYHFITPELRPQLKTAWISQEVMGSDHCPLGIELSL